MKKLRLLAAAAMAVGGALLVAPMAYAEPAPHPVVSTCHAGWYVNPDEAALLPDQVEGGFLFDGPSLVHRALATPVLLAAVPLDGAFVTSGAVVGVPPLFKMETTGPYSTINKTGAGTYWSSKIASGPGSQGEPVATVAALAALSPYSATTAVYSFGVGYANDAGNKALVSSITFGGTTHGLTCVPAPSSSSAAPSASVSSTPPSTPPASSATPSAPASSTPPATAPPSASTSPSAVVVVPAGSGTGRLPLTGYATMLTVGVGVLLLVVGGGLWAYSRRRTTEFVA